MGENQTAAVMIASALALEKEQKGLVPAVRGMLAAVASHPGFSAGEDDERVLLALGVLMCSLAEVRKTGGRTADGAKLARLAAAIIDCEARVRAGGTVWSEEWLLGLVVHNLRHDMWRSLARYLLVEPEREHPAEAVEVLRLIGGMLVR